MAQNEIRLTGSGGQGLILAGIILAEAALLQGNNAVQSQSYGPEARGGASKSEVIISKEDIDFPKVNKADILLSLTQIAYDKYKQSTKESATVIVDSTINIDETLKVERIIKIPIIETASNKIGKSIVSNIVALGAIQEATGIVDRDFLEKAVLNRVPAKFKDLNRKALSEGFNLIKE
ncbi:MAG TPA: 2-oxoacid:acceptor oxidoreductase family protein [Clostridia bacterium]|nr:2-oxoacid:acceptor oxidoreductase family protein [Clostridia bacterium]